MESFNLPILLLPFLSALCEWRHIACSSENVLSGTDQRPVELAWGIPDIQSTVGKLLNFTIPKDAFDGEIFDIKAREFNKDTLLDWLTFDPIERRFIGLPTKTKDIGTYYIAVTVFGAQTSLIQDVFSLTVEELLSNSQSTFTAAETILTIFLDADWERMTMHDRIALLTKVSNYLDTPVTQFKITALTEKASFSLFDASAIMAGPGNIKDVKFSGIRLSIIVGSDGELSGKHNKELVAFVEEAAKDGSMARFIGVDIVGWHLSTSKPILPSRVRRQISFLNTREPSPVAPTIERAGTPVVNTPYLSETPGVDSRVGITVPEIKPTGATNIIVVPTVSLPLAAATPELIFTMKSSTKPMRSTLSPKIGLPIGDGKEIVFLSGEKLEFSIPLDAFGSTNGSKKRVSILEEEKTPWLQVINNADGSSKLVGLPLPSDAGTYHLHLEGANEMNLIQIPIKIGIKDLEEMSKLNHEFGVVLDEPFNQFNLSRRLQFVDTLRAYYRDSDATSIAIRSIQSGSTHITWTNQSLIAKDCSDVSIKSVASAIQTPNDQINLEFQEYLKKTADFKVDKVVVKQLGLCAKDSATKEAEKDIYLSTILPIAIVACLLLISCGIGCFLFKKNKRANRGDELDAPFSPGRNTPLIIQGDISDDKNSTKPKAGSKKTTFAPQEHSPNSPPEYPGRRNSAATNQTATTVSQVDEDEQQPLTGSPTKSPRKTKQQPPDLSFRE